MDKLKQLTAKKQELDKARPLPPELVKNLNEWFNIELTYTSNAIEGNTLSRAETALVVEKGITVEGKTLQEHLEAINHAEALSFIETLVSKKRAEITQNDILDIHRLILTRIDIDNAGRIRNVPVRIAGSRVVMPNALKVPELMEEFMGWLHSSYALHPVRIAAEAHYKLVTIHPFIDGNGRTARLLMNLLLMQEGYPPAIIQKEDRKRYINAIEKAQLGVTLNDFLELIYKAEDRSLDIYLEAVKGILPSAANISITISTIKIGELAKVTNETVPTLRFWTREGLLNVKSHTDSGYQLYEPTMVNRVQEIRRLQKEKRLTLQEIKQKLK